MDNEKNMIENEQLDIRWAWGDWWWELTKARIIN